MSLTNFSLPKLHECLQEEVDAMLSLAELLKAEQASLIDGNVEKLGELTQEKSRRITLLAELEKKRNAYLIQLGYSSDAKGMQDYLSHPSTEILAAEYWGNLLQISEQAKESNRANGILINRQLTKNQSALNILQQNNPAGSMYGPNGQSTNSNLSGRGFVIG
ncbi:MAG: flagellar protein FlgN [Undibacterium sp.]|uniref:flagella synthesis protein FlgN n=1 Tax=Undibacterium sp. TaxID=1914977 RepID=UPI002727A3A9|nr:flagellar protein FlgN [Undibacterium sp.]MDO8653695.1 flagellar protein FlgN [Undibacterium sp.]